MTQARGSSIRFMIAEEASWGVTPSAPVGQVFPVLSCGLKASRNQIQSAALRSNRQPLMPGDGNWDVSGSVAMELHPMGMGTLLKHALGADTVTGTASPYTHTIKAADSLPAGLSIEKGMTDIAKYFKYTGCKVNQIVLSAPVEGIVAVTFDFIGKDETVAGTSMDATPVTYAYSPFTGFEGVVKVGGSQVGYITSYDNITLLNNLDGSIYTFPGATQSAGYKRSLPEGKIIVTGSFSYMFENTTIYDFAKNSMEKALDLIFTKGTGAGTTGNEKLTITIPEVHFKPESPEISGDQGIIGKADFTAYYDNASEATSLQMVLLNSQATI